MTWRSKDRKDPGYNKFRKAVLDRDGHTCQMPNCNRRYGLSAHHIVPYSKSAYLRVDPDNGITLCKRCHYLIRKQEEHYAPLFMMIVAKNKFKDK
jgi:5-methylcytosine-specific restriction endonuclease McrA